MRADHGGGLGFGFPANRESGRENEGVRMREKGEGVSVEFLSTPGSKQDVARKRRGAARLLAEEEDDKRSFFEKPLEFSEFSQLGPFP